MISFAIPTKIESEEQEIFLENLISSIKLQTVNVEHEILICGNYKNKYVKTIDFPEDKNGTSYITRKQNLLLDNATYENIIFLRDYYWIWSDWVDGFLYWHTKDKSYWNIMMSPVINRDGSRFRDICNYNPFKKPHIYMTPYHNIDYNEFYINGGLLIAKTYFLKSIRWDDNKQHLEAEDIDLSMRLRQSNRMVYAFNPYSIIQLQKYKSRDIPIFPSEYFGSMEYVMRNYRNR